MRVALLFLVAAVTASCNRDAGGEPQTMRTIHYDRLEGGDSASFTLVTVCELFGRPGPVGVFTVREIIGNAQGVRAEPVIRVTADTEQVWSGSVGSSYTYTFEGGWNGDSYLVPSMTAEVGERLVLVIHEEWGIPHELHVFREIRPGRYSNGQIFAEDGIGLSELRMIIEEVRSAEVCPFDARFGYPTALDGGRGDVDEGFFDYSDAG